ncbi:hypothetical protein DAEQUDRAFT_232046 [Daedalea quercina L-15889]|uniref:WW domain-containing protein n=1 Tax=Daedalea quercina L-15889 TaxID=1314783 RepID=A0A165QU74_9APHY|nr:hypothetical protein DAEQUDRAFT_232046 [Daedalea quercina L-15889]
MARSLPQQLLAVLRYLLSWRPSQRLVRPLTLLRPVWQWCVRRNPGLRPSRKRDGGGDGQNPFAPAGDVKIRVNGNTSIVYASEEPAAYPPLRNRHAHFPSDLSRDSNPSGSQPLSDQCPGSPLSEKGSGPYSFKVQTASSGSLASSQQSNYGPSSVHDDHLSVTLSRPSSRVSMRIRDDRLSRLITPSDSRRPAARSTSRNRSRSRTPAASPSHSTVSVTLSNGSSASRSNVATPAHELGRRRRTQKTYPVVQTHRYDRTNDLEEEDFAYTISPMKMSYAIGDLPQGWEARPHPEGCLYFFNPARRIYTEAWIYDGEILEEIEDFAQRLQEIIRENNFDVPADADLVLELEDIPGHAPPTLDIVSGEPSVHYWTYYYVNHASRVLFWLQEYDIADDIEKVRCIQSDTHIKYGIESFYWKHFEYFPAGHTLTPELTKEVLSILAHANVDQITSKSSTVAMRPEELLTLADMIQKSQDAGSNDYTKVARIDRSKSCFGDSDSKKRSPLFLAFSLLFFNAPEMHLRTLEEAWIDGTINEIFWAKCVEKLQKDWEEAVLTATVVLNANISFLTINDVDSGTGPRTPAQLASYVSTIASIAAVVIGMLLVRQHRVSPKETATDAVTYLQSRNHQRLGLKVLGLVHSLPYALLMWAVVSFLVAFACENFRVPDVPSIIVATTAWGLSAALLVLCLHTIWEGGSISIRAELDKVRKTVYNHLNPLQIIHCVKAIRRKRKDTGSDMAAAMSAGIEMQSHISGDGV